MSIRIESSKGAALFAACLMAAACGNSDNGPAKKGGDAGSTGNRDASATPDSGMDVVTSDAGSDAAMMANGCPSELSCQSPTGVYLCEKAGGVPVTCESKSDCSFGMCYPISGVGLCVQLCSPDEGLPATTSVSGRVVEFAAGTGFLGTSQAPKEKVLADVDVCVTAKNLTKSFCTKSGADGTFKLDGLPPNRSVSMPVTGTITFKKDGYLNTAEGFSFGNGSQVLGNQVRLMTLEEAQSLATAAGTTLPDATHGWLGFDAMQLNKDGATRMSTFLEDKFALMTVEGAVVASTPAAGLGPFYADESEHFSFPATGDAGVGDAGVSDGTSIAGFGYFLGVPAGSYKLSFTHPSLDCGTATTIAVLPGFLLNGIGALCGNGIH